MKTKENIKSNVKGHIEIIDAETEELIYENHNDIHSFNFSKLIASALSGNSEKLFINSLKFGNGGVFIDNNGDSNFSPANTTIHNATLYNTTWIEYFDGSNPLNEINVVTNPTEVSSSIVVQVVLGPNRPSGQSISDDTGSTQYIQVKDSLNTSQKPFTFSEMGLFDSDDNMLTHLIFSPIEKTQNRTLIIQYTLNFLVN